jgi:hypothetical protein
MKLLIYIASALTFSVLLSQRAYAVCPICTVAVGAGLGISRVIGIDDAITGLWIGGLILSSGLWMADFIRKKGWKVKYPEVVSVVLMFLFVIPPLYWSRMIGLPGNTILGIDKIIFGSTIGFIVFWFGVLADKWLRTKNNGKVYIYFQKVILPVLMLSITSYILYLVTT